jgi:hypothetical protein
MTQIRPRINADLAADVQAFADSYGKETGIPVSFNTAVKILLRAGLDAAPVPRTLTATATEIAEAAPAGAGTITGTMTREEKP